MSRDMKLSTVRFVGLALFAAVWLGSGAAHSALNDAMRVVSATDTRVVFEIDFSAYKLEPSTALEGTERLTIDGFGGFSEPGRPSVPGRCLLVGVPPSGDPLVTWSVVRSEPLGSHRLEPVAFPRVLEDENGDPYASEEYRIDPAVYGTGATSIGVVAEPVGRLRHQRVLPVRVVPIAYDPATGETTIATLIRVEVSFPAVRGSGGSLDRNESQLPDAPVWERLYGRVLVNPSQAAKWRVREAANVRDLPGRGAVSEALSGPLVKVLVRDTGLHRVSAASVIAKGFPLGSAVSSLKVFKRTYDPATFSEGAVDVAFRVVEDPAGTAGVFDANDWVVFFAKRLREDDLQGDPLEKFTGSNVYWLGTSGGVQMPSVAVDAGFVSADTASAAFPVTRYFEEDNVFMEGTPPDEKEFYYFNDWYLTSAYSSAFTAPSIDPTGTFVLKARFLGGKRTSANRIVKLSIRNSKGTTVLDDAAVLSKNIVTYTSQTLSGSAIDGGANTFRVDKTSDRDMLEVLLDWFTIEYRAKYRANGNVLEFNSAALSGDTSITVTGLTRTDVMLFDVTDPYGTRLYTLTPSHFTDTGGTYAVSFREGIASQKKYVVAPLDAIPQIGSADVVADEPSGLIGNSAENGVDILVVSHSDFLGEMQRWVGYRRAQGYRVLTADPQEIFDEFNGGVENPRGIKNFIRHFYGTGGASFVLFVGDASEDNRGVNQYAGKNFVPTESFTEYVGGSFGDEVVTTDNWYVLLDHDFINDPSVLVSDYFPDLIIGRMPVGTVTELRYELEKIFKFEAPKGDDFWRRRMIRVADNAFSGDFNYCYQSSEEGFQAAEETAAQKAEAAIPGGFDIVRFYLTDYLAGVEPAHQPGSCLNGGVFQAATENQATPQLLSELNAGASIVSFQAHMDRSRICHEALFSTSETFGSDHFRLTNVDRPWVAFGFGCHMSDYSLFDEKARTITNPPTGDCFSELLLNQRSGAVSVYASAGFEYLTPNRNFTAFIADALFDEVPTDTMIASTRAQARWILGELLTLAEIQNLLNNMGGSTGSVGQTKRFVLLGDPVLRVDAGPPRFQVTVNGEPFASGDLVAPDADNMIRVSATVTDEVAIEKLALEIAGADSSGILTVTPLKDQDLSAARQYEVSFAHHIQAKRYDIILRAYQAEDTTAGTYHLAAEFVMKVQAVAELAVNGRPVYDGDIVPPKGEYEFKVALPVYVEQSVIRVETDGAIVAPVSYAHPSPADTLTWLVRFQQTLSDGPHQVVLFVGEAEFPFSLIVGTHTGLLDLIAFPNPFEDEVDFVFTNEVAISEGSIGIFTVSGKKVAHIEVPAAARSPGQNAVRWNGRTFNGDEVANGTYLFVASVEQNGRKTTQRGTLVRMK